MSRNFESGDFLVFQLESGFALLRLLAIDDNKGGPIWHIAAYNDFFPDVDSTEAAAADPSSLTTANKHIALTNRAFESTQVAKIFNADLSENELDDLNRWRGDASREIWDRSVRLMLGLR